MILPVKALTIIASRREFSLKVETEKAIKLIFLEEVNSGSMPFPEAAVVLLLQFDLIDLAKELPLRIS